MSHGNAQPGVGNRGDVRRHAGRLAADHQDVVRREAEIVGRGLALRRQKDQTAALLAPPGVEVREAVVVDQGRRGAIIEAGAAEMPVAQRERGWTDDVQYEAEAGGQPNQGAGVLRDFGLVEREVDRDFPSSSRPWRGKGGYSVADP